MTILAPPQVCNTTTIVQPESPTHITLDQELKSNQLKLNKACEQLQHLDLRLQHHWLRMKTAEKLGQGAVLYSSQIQMCILGSVRAMFEEYAARKLEKVKILRIGVIFRDVWYEGDEEEVEDFDEDEDYSDEELQ